MKETNNKNAEKAIRITTILTVLIAGFEIINALGYYQPGMNLLDIASYVFANPWIYGFTFIFVNLVMLPGALALYKTSGISLKDEIYEKKTLGGDILWGMISREVLLRRVSCAWMKVSTDIRTEYACGKPLMKQP